MRIEGASTNPPLTLAWDYASGAFELDGRQVEADELVTMPVGLVGRMMRDAISDAINLIADAGLPEVETVETTRFTYDDSGRISGKVVEVPSLASRFSRRVHESRAAAKSSTPAKRGIGFRPPTERGL